MAETSFVTPFPFKPTGGRSLDLTSTTSAAILLPGYGPHVIVSNTDATGAVWALVEFGDADTAVATTHSHAVKPGESVLFTIPPVSAANPGAVCAYFAAKTDTGVTTIKVSQGFGV
jgi:hypothetical protein